MWLCLNFLAFFIMVKPLLLVIKKMTAQATKITKIIRIYLRSSGLCCFGFPGPNVPSVIQRKKMNKTCDNYDTVAYLACNIMHHIFSASAMGAGDLGTCPLKHQNRQKLSKKNGMKLVGYAFTLKNDIQILPLPSNFGFFRACATTAHFV